MSAEFTDHPGLPRCWLCGGTRDWLYVTCDACHRRHQRDEAEAQEPVDEPLSNDDGFFDGNRGCK